MYNSLNYNFIREEVYSRTGDSVRLLRITLRKPLQPRQLRHLYDAIDIALRDIEATEGLVVSGNLPSWALAAVSAYLEPRVFLAIHVPSFGGAIIVGSLLEGKNVGDIIPEEDLERLNTLGVIF